MITAAFWMTAAILLYLHGGYAICLAVAAWLRRPQARGTSGPVNAQPVTVVVGVYNEERVIGAKLNSVIKQDYRGRLDVVVTSDCSSDGTDAIVSSFAAHGVRLIRSPSRRGKAANISAIVPQLTTDVVILTDAGAMFEPDTVRKLMLHFQDPSVGCVGGRLVYENADATGISRGEGLYWRYEVLLRTLESRVGGTVIVSGACYAIRRGLFRPVPPELPDDFMSPLNVWDQGARVLYEPDARLTERVAETMAGEFRTKVRIISRNATALWRMKHLLNPLARPGLAWKLWSHRLLRWLVLPILVVFLGLNLLLVPAPLYTLLALGQGVFYTLAALGTIPVLRRYRVFWIPLYFCLVNASALVGVWKALAGRLSGTWEPAERQAGG